MLRKENSERLNHLDSQPFDSYLVLAAKLGKSLIGISMNYLFCSDVVEAFPDFNEIIFESKSYQKGAPNEIAMAVITSPASFARSFN